MIVVGIIFNYNKMISYVNNENIIFKVIIIALVVSIIEKLSTNC